MPLHAIDLLTPRGRLNGAALWPGTPDDEVRQKLEEFLDQGYDEAADITDEADLDAAARLWAYYRAWDEVYQRLLAMPSTVETSDQGSASYLLTQIEHIGELAAGAKAEFDAMIAAVATDEPLPPVPHMSASVPVRFVF